MAPPAADRGRRIPGRTDEDLRPVVPDPCARWDLLTHLRPRPLGSFDEPVPVFAGWPDAPFGYLRFRGAYAVPAGHAGRRGRAH